MTDAPKKSKPYETTASGGIRVVSGRKIGEVRIPNYVYDLWLPLLGGEAIAVYGVYCRLERAKVVKGISFRKIAVACQIGDAKLNSINEMLIDCGFVTIKKPTGTARGQHLTSEIITLDPPRKLLPEIIEKYKGKRGYAPLSEWLVSGENDTPDSGSCSENHQAADPEPQPTAPIGLREPPDSVSPDTKQCVTEALDSVSISLQPFNLQPLIQLAEAASLPESSQPAREAAAAAVHPIPAVSVVSKPNGVPPPVQNAPSPGSAPPPSPANVFKLYEQNIGALTPLIADAIKDAVKDFTEQWVMDAIGEAARANGKSWNYIRAILDRWQRDGRNAPPISRAPRPSPASPAPAPRAASPGAPNARPIPRVQPKGEPERTA